MSPERERESHLSRRLARARGGQEALSGSLSKETDKSRERERETEDVNERKRDRGDKRNKWRKRKAGRMQIRYIGGRNNESAMRGGEREAEMKGEIRWEKLLLSGVRQKKVFIVVKRAEKD